MRGSHGTAECQSKAGLSGAQTPFLGLSRADRGLLKSLGRRWNDDINSHRNAVVEVYSRKLALRDRTGIGLRRDLAYGQHSRQVLDVFFPEAPGEPRPVVVFIHGGAFTRGSKSTNGLIYDNVLLWFVRNGAVGVNVEYRLAPQVTWPSGAKDVARAVEWVMENATDFGGDPGKIALVGHSAGGSHAASYLCDPTIGETPPPNVRVLVLISARLRADTRHDNPNRENVAAYFGSDEEQYCRMSPVAHASRLRVPGLVAFAEHENRHLDLYAQEFFAAMPKETAHSRLLPVEGHNHTSIVAHFDTEEIWLPRQICRFFHDCGLY